MAPLQGSRHGKTESEELLHGFARFVLTFCLSMFFVGCGLPPVPPTAAQVANRKQRAYYKTRAK